MPYIPDKVKPFYAEEPLPARSLNKDLLVFLITESVITDNKKRNLALKWVEIIFIPRSRYRIMKTQCASEMYYKNIFD